ncbi:MAG: Crp/Fnr family transcriptional regulator [Coriobacteriales bacterium]|nr:Crp/Fnr family transcriptional regulator [Actinomycetes bacterium]
MRPARPDVVAALRACRLWRAATDTAIERLAASATVEQAARGTALASEGEVADRFAVVVAGKARVYHLQADGRIITFETVESGEPLAAVASLAGARYPANIDAATDATIAWLSRDALFTLIAEEPDVARSVIADLAGRVVNLTAVVQTLALDVPARVARYLFQRSLAVGEATPEGLRVSLGMTKTELAHSLGTVPETLSRAFARLKGDGVLDVRGPDVIVHDVGALARLGSGYAEE